MERSTPIIKDTMKKILFVTLFLLSFSITAQTVVTGGNSVTIIQGSGTDNQQLTLVGNTLTLEDGGTVDLSPYLDNKNVTSGNYVGGNLTLTLSDASTVVIDLSNLIADGTETKLTAGTNVTITGTGTVGDPYVINSSGGGGGSIEVRDEGSQLTATASSIDFTGTGVQATVIGDAITVNVPSSGGGAYTVAPSEADITAAGANATIEIRADIVLSANYTPPANQHWVFTTGSIDLVTFTLTGNNTSWEGPQNKILFDTFSGTLAGTWIPPKVIHSKQFGVISDGYKLKNAGAITSGSSTLTVTGANFTADDVGEFIAIQGAHSGYLEFNRGPYVVPEYNSVHSLRTTIASVVNSTTVTLANAASRTVTSAEVWTGSDNLNSGKQFIYMGNQKDGTVFVFDEDGTGIIFRSREDELSPPFDLNDRQTSWTFGEGADDLTVLNETRLCLIPHNNYTSRFIKVYNTHRFRWEGGTLEGEFFMHEYSNTNPGLADEGCHGLVPNTLAINATVKNLDIIGFTGDGALGQGSLQFGNYIKGSAASGYPGASEFELGTYNETTGAAEASSVYARTTVALDVTGTSFQNTRLRHPTRQGLRSFEFSGSSFAGWSGLDNMRFRAFFYDASDNFVGVSRELEFYGDYSIPEEAAKVHIVIDAPADLTAIDTQVRAPIVPEKWVFDNVNIYDCGRHGMANSPNNFTWTNSEIGRIGPTLPARAFNDEDYRESKENLVLENLVIFDVFGGGINLIGNRNTHIKNVTFKGSSGATYAEGAQFMRGLETFRGRKVSIEGCILINSTANLGRGNVWTGGQMFNGTIQAEANSVQIKDFTGWNAYILDAVYDPIVDREHNFLEDSKFFFDRPVTSYISDRNRLWKMKNVEFIANNKTQLNSTNFQFDDTYEEVVLTSSIDTGIWSNTAPTNDFNTPIYDVTFKGARTSLAARDFTGPTFTLVNTYGLTAENNVVYIGPERDYELNDLTIDGWLEFQLTTWSGTLSSPSTITLNRPYVHVDSGTFNWTNTGSNVFTTPAKNMNLVVNDGVFELNAAATVIGSSNKFIDLDHLGTSTFRNTTFRSTVNTSIPFNLTNTTIFNPSLGAVTFIDCEFEGVNLTLRSGDKRLFTKPHPDLEVYADNAAATAGGIPAGYMYRTSTGDVKVVY